MIEFTRYTRLKPKGVVSVRDQADGVTVVFKRFDNETGAELPDPEESFVSFDELEKKAEELERDLAVCRELLARKT